MSARSRPLTCSVDLPEYTNRLVANGVGGSLREVSKLVSQPLAPPRPGEVLVEVKCAGVDAKFHSVNALSKANCDQPLGETGVGTVMAVGEGVDAPSVGQHVVFMGSSYATFTNAPAMMCWAIDSTSPDFIVLRTAGLPALVGLKVSAQLKAGETVLVTAGTGSAGSCAVQIAKAMGCTVIAVCGGKAKADIVRGLGADRVIDYRSEDLGKVLRKEYPGGIDVVFDGVGGRFFKSSYQCLAEGGRLLIVGIAAGSKTGGVEKHVKKSTGLDPSSIFARRQTVTEGTKQIIGNVWPMEYLRSKPLQTEIQEELLRMYSEGKLKPLVSNEPFQGLESVADAVDFVARHNSAGKVVVHI